MLNNNVFSRILFVVLAFGIFWACNDQGELGPGVIDAEGVDFFNNDTIPFTAITRSADSVAGAGFSKVFIGRTEDEVFGSFESSFYAQLSLVRTGETFDMATVDSVFLELQYDTLIYGDANSMFDIYVHRLLETPDEDDDIYTNIEFDVSSTAIGSIEGFVPRVRDTTIMDTVETVSAAKLRIPLDISLGEELLSYSEETYESSEELKTQFKGIYVTGSSDNQSMITLLPINFSSSNLQSRLVVHYTEDSEQKEFQLATSTLDYRLARLQKDQSSGEIASYIDNATSGESQLFVSGLNGNYIEINLQEASDFLLGKFLNKAEICFPLNEMEFNYDYTLYPELNIFSGRYDDQSGATLTLTDDLILNSLSGLTDNGSLVEDDSTGVKQYCSEITIQLQSIVRKEFDPNIYFIASTRTNNPNKSILNGANHPDQPARLRIIYSEQQ